VFEPAHRALVIPVGVCQASAHRVPRQRERNLAKLLVRLLGRRRLGGAGELFLRRLPRSRPVELAIWEVSTL
jgi:hypothetical protein